MFDGTFTVGQPISSTEFPRQSFVSGHVTVVANPSGSGAAVVRMAVANSDQPYSGSHPRADMLTQNWYTQGSTLFTSIPVEIPTGLPPFHDNASSFFQWAEAKDTAASSPSWGLGLDAPSGTANHYELGTTSNVGYPWLGPVVDGKWHTAVVEAYYTKNAGQGWLQLWWDGQPVTFNQGAFAGKTRVTGITTITDGAAAWPLDIDNYRSSNTDPGTLTIFHGSPKIGTTLASVIGATTTPPAVDVAAFTPAPRTSTVGQTVSLDGSASTCTAAPCTYAWSGNGNRLGTGQTLKYAFHYVGTKTITLTMTDAAGATASVEHDYSVTAAPVVPLAAAFTAPATSKIGQTVTFNAAASTGDPTRYAWTDGANVLGTGETLPFTFHYVGTKHVLLTVTNAAGKTATVEHDLPVSQ